MLQVIGQLLVIVFLIFVVLFPIVITFDDGPFLGSAVSRFEENQLSHPNCVIPYKRGQIEIYNRELDESPPVVLYRIGTRIRWSRIFSVGKLGNASVDKIESVKILEGGLRGDKLDFTVYWTYGAEHGYAFISPFRMKTFYLSW